MTKWCGDLWGLVEVMVRRCSALLVLGLGEVRGFGWGFFGAITFLGTLGAARSTRIFWGWWIFCDSFFGALGATRILRVGILGVLGATRSS